MFTPGLRVPQQRPTQPIPQPQPQQQQQTSGAHVAFEDAIATLQGMFPTFDRGVIASMLEVNNGHMEKTVDNLLALCDDTPDFSVVEPVEPSYPAARRVPTSTLPADFLSFDEPTGPAPTAQMAEDERFARMLQDQLFMDELRQNPEIAAALSASGHGVPPEFANGGAPMYSRTAAEPAPAETDSVAEFKKKLFDMSEGAKQKFRELSTRWGTQRGGSAQYVSLNADDDDDAEVLNFDRTDSALGPRRQRVDDDDFEAEFSRGDSRAVRMTTRTATGHKKAD
eukprot:TRINITY_DN422_c0_g1_i1.p1 TRINITY_DN422_c0_g1~~TRINITY_DN422_c0_g1_i1.p1  ORF type:complete len:301 (-),score=64.00 TRINITY_DN422_c0_g1_i1:64-909(-)